MNRYVLVFFGPGKRPKSDFDTISRLPGLKVVRSDSSNVMVVEAEPNVKKVVNQMHGWMASEETTMSAPAPMRY